jgi:hypothetical protein
MNQTWPRGSKLLIDTRSLARHAEHTRKEQRESNLSRTLPAESPRRGVKSAITTGIWLISSPVQQFSGGTPTNYAQRYCNSQTLSKHKKASQTLPALLSLLPLLNN